MEKTNYTIFKVCYKPNITASFKYFILSSLSPEGEQFNMDFIQDKIEENDYKLSKQDEKVWKDLLELKVDYIEL